MAAVPLSIGWFAECGKGEPNGGERQQVLMTTNDFGICTIL